MIIKRLHQIGVTSEQAYAAGFAAIGLSILSWMVSAKAEAAGIERADRWGIFVGEWAPTFFALGLALSSYEKGLRRMTAPRIGPRIVARKRREPLVLGIPRVNSLRG